MADLKSSLSKLLSRNLDDSTALIKQASEVLTTGGIGCSQFNELLLLLGIDRITKDFFQFLVDQGREYVLGSAIESLDSFDRNVEKFRQFAMLGYGSIVFGFQQFSNMEGADLQNFLSGFDKVNPDEYKLRHEEFLKIKEIPSDKTYYLGYVIQSSIESRLKANPKDPEALQDKKEMEDIIEQGKYNQKCYLASDHMDVYVATSMRERHEYVVVNDFVKEVFDDPRLTELKLRYFNPTQAYCKDRIDKGLSEGLMLKRAILTLYLVQETDTFGKDSELASTLAQGKPVIAYVPSVEEPANYARKHVDKIMATSGQKEIQVILDQLKIYGSSEIWSDSELLSWASDPTTMNKDSAIKKLGDLMKKMYDKRANVLSKVHPLGIQVYLSTGVANGVLVCRTPAECSELISRIVLGTMTFSIDDVGGGYLFLREELTSSIFRVVTGDAELTKSFWNFYDI